MQPQAATPPSGAHRASRGHGEDERRRGQAAGAATAGPHRRSAPTRGGPHRAGPRRAAAAGPLRRCRAPPCGGLGGADQATAWADLGPRGVDPAADQRKVPPPPWTRPSARSARGEEGEEVRGRSPAAVFLAAAWTSSGRSGDGEGWERRRAFGPPEPPRGGRRGHQVADPTSSYYSIL